MTIAINEKSSVPSNRFATQRFVLRRVTWEGYESILEALREQRVFVTYNRGALELMSPSPEHERIGWLLARMIHIYTECKRVPLMSLGMTTWRREASARGLEADQCFFVQHEPQVRGKREFDPAVDPPPDLAIEVDLKSSSVAKEEVYAGLGIAELWRYDNGRVVIMVLGREGRYQEVPSGPALPALLTDVLTDWVERGLGMGETDFAIAFREWAEQAD